MIIFCSNCGNQNKETESLCSVCKSPLNLNPVGPLPEGAILENRYTIVNLIKTGGMGAVYKAKNNKLDSICAIKELLPPYGTSERHSRATEWFKREAKLLAGLDHPNLPGVFDYFVSNGRYYLVMTFIEGEDLECKMEKEGNPGLPPEKVIAWAKEIAGVLSYLHNQNPPVIYRDMKPSNIMIHKDGRAILVDFGLARVIHHDSRSQKTAIGTTGYAPPEQWRGSAEARSDIYALGATLHHLLTGIEPLPFRFEPLSKILPEIPLYLEMIIMKALRDNPEERFSCAEEMQMAMSYGEEKPVITVTSKIERKEYDYSKAGRKLWEFKTDESVESTPCIDSDLIYFGSDKFYCLSAKYGTKLWEFKADQSISSKASVSGDRIYFISKDCRVYCLEREKGEKIWEFKAGNWAGGAGHISNPSLVENKVYFGSSDYNLYCLDGKYGSTLWKFKTDDWIPSSPCISGDFIYFGSNDKKLYCLDKETGMKVWEFKSGDSIYSSPCIEKDFIYFGSRDYNFYCLNRTKGQKIWHFRTKGSIYSSPCIYEDFVYFGSNDKKIYCLNSRTGEKIWEFKTERNIHSDPCGSEGLLYFGCNDGNLYCLDAGRGIKIREFKTGDKVKSTPVVYDGFIYFGSNDKKLYCLHSGKK